jgi:hypothetical protein
LHFPGNRGFGVHNEPCSHIDYILCSLEAAHLNGEGVSLKSQWWAFYMLSTLPPAVPAGASHYPPECGRGRTPRPRAFYAGRSRLSASGHDGSPPGGRPDGPAGRKPHSHSPE